MNIARQTSGRRCVLHPVRGPWWWKRCWCATRIRWGIEVSRWSIIWWLRATEILNTRATVIPWDGSCSVRTRLAWIGPRWSGKRSTNIGISVRCSRSRERGTRCRWSMCKRWAAILRSRSMERSIRHNPRWWATRMRTGWRTMRS